MKNYLGNGGGDLGMRCSLEESDREGGGGGWFTNIVLAHMEWVSGNL